MLEVMIGAAVLVTIAVAGLAIRLLFNRNAEFSGGSCESSYGSEELSEQGIKCGCAGECAGSKES